MRLIQLTAAYAGPTDAKVWLNADKIVKMDRNGEVTRIYHEPYDQVAQSLDYTDVEEEPWQIAKAAHEAIAIDGTICTTTP